METRWLPALVVVGITVWPGRSMSASGAVHPPLRRVALRSRPPHRRQLATGLRRGARDYRRPDYLLDSVGRKATAVAGQLLRILQDRLPPDRDGASLILALDDSPTKRSGSHVEGRANITTRPRGRPGRSSTTATSGSVSPGGPAPAVGDVALPILAHLYIRAKDVG